MSMSKTRIILAAVVVAVFVGAGVFTIVNVPRMNGRRPSSAPLARAHEFKPTYEQELWFLATNALLTRRNGDRFDVLGGANPTKKKAEVWQRVLRNSWDVYDRADLMDALRSLQEYGHRGAFDDVAAALADSLERIELQQGALTDPDLANEMAIVMEYGDQVGSKSLMGFDLARYVGLCGWGFIAGYLTREEAWELLVPAGRRLQETFGSWRELGENYLIGRQFWSRDATERNHDEYRAALEWLCTDPESPWVRIPWDLDLQPQE